MKEIDAWYIYYQSNYINSNESTVRRGRWAGREGAD